MRDQGARPGFTGVRGKAAIRNQTDGSILPGGLPSLGYEQYWKDGIRLPRQQPVYANGVPIRDATGKPLPKQVLSSCNELYDGLLDESREGPVYRNPGEPARSEQGFVFPYHHDGDYNQTGPDRSKLPINYEWDRVVRTDGNVSYYVAFNGTHRVKGARVPWFPEAQEAARQGKLKILERWVIGIPNPDTPIPEGYDIVTTRNRTCFEPTFAALPQIIPTQPERLYHACELLPYPAEMCGVTCDTWGSTPEPPPPRPPPSPPRAPAPPPQHHCRKTDEFPYRFGNITVDRDSRNRTRLCGDITVVPCNTNDTCCTSGLQKIEFFIEDRCWSGVADSITLDGRDSLINPSYDDVDNKPGTLVFKITGLGMNQTTARDRRLCFSLFNSPNKPCETIEDFCNGEPGTCTFMTMSAMNDNNCCKVQTASHP